MLRSLAPNTTRVAIDFDGVLFRHPRAHAIVARRCDRFVAEKLGISLAVGRELNRATYPAFGHTARALEHLSGAPVSLEEYNAFVYAPDVLAAATDAVRRDAGAHDLARAHDAVRALAARDDSRAFVLTDAPVRWLEAMYAASDLPPPDVPVVCAADALAGRLKSDPEAPAAARDLWGDDVVLVDDSAAIASNFVRGSPWRVVLVAPGPSAMGARLTVARSVHEAIGLL